MRVSWILSCWCTLTLIQVLAIIYDYLLFMRISCLHQTDSQTFSTISKYLALNNCKLSFCALIASIQPFKASLTFSTRSFPDKQLHQILIFTWRTKDDENRHFFVGGKIVPFFSRYVTWQRNSFAFRKTSRKSNMAAWVFFYSAHLSKACLTLGQPEFRKAASLEV